ncbi:hypothetical protein FRC04_002942 [Tulasnella sp. 424]|nr:hypothetical protein FRC04_002942 [Tulasnella sp. 424]
MSRSHSLNDVVIKVLPRFPEHFNSFKAILPSPEAPDLHGDLLSRLKSFKVTIKAPSPMACDTDRLYRDFLWTQARKTGLVLSLLTAMGHKATLEADVTGITSERIFGPLDEDNTEIIRAAAEAIPRAISAYWREPSSRICPCEAPPMTNLLHLEYIVELVCLVGQLMERGRDPKAMVWPTESDALREL